MIGSHFITAFMCNQGAIFSALEVLKHENEIIVASIAMHDIQNAQSSLL